MRRSLLFLAALLVVAPQVSASPLPPTAVGGPASVSPEALEKARGALEAGLYGEVAALLEPIRDDLPPAGSALLGRALALDRRYTAAEGPLARAVEGGHRTVETLFYLGSTLWENGKAADAASALEAALRLSGRHPAILQQLGRLELWRGRYEAALEWLREASVRAPDDLDLTLDRARALAAVGRLEEALAAYRQVLSGAPDHHQAAFGLGRTLVALGRIEEGRRELERARRLYEEEQERTLAAGRFAAELAGARALIHAGTPAEAVEKLRRLPESVDSLSLLATALAAAGREGESVEALERAVSLAPERRDLRDRLAAARLAGSPTGER